MSEFAKFGDIAKGEGMDTLWKMYRRQKDAEADAGADVDADVSRMRGWFKLVAEGKATAEELDRRFPDVLEHHADCPRCRGTGMFFSRKTKKSRQVRGGGRDTFEVEGMKTCNCDIGRRKLKGIRELGREKKKSRRGEI